MSNNIEECILIINLLLFKNKNTTDNCVRFGYNINL